MQACRHGGWQLVVAGLLVVDTVVPAIVAVVVPRLPCLKQAGAAQNGSVAAMSQADKQLCKLKTNGRPA